MKINEIKKTKSGKYRIKIDDKIFTTYDDVLIKNNIIYKKNIDVSIFEQMQKDHKYYDAYNKAMSFILKRVRSKSELKNFLEKFDISKDSKNKIFIHLQEIGLVNDEKYVNSFISDSIYLKLDGPNKIKSSLLLMQIDSNLIDNCLKKIDKEIFEKNLRKIIDKKMSLRGKYSKYQLRQKIILDMINKGYEKDDIVSILYDYEYDDNTLLTKEFDKLYRKLQTKFSGNELNNKLRQRLYAKGFDLIEINNLIVKKEEE